MKTWLKPWMLVMVGLLLVNLVAPFTLRANLRDGVYAVHADSISIGLFQIWALSAVGAVGFAWVAGTAAGVRWLCACWPKAWWRGACAVVVVLAYAVALFYFALWTLAWSQAHHAPIAACAAATTLAVAWAGWRDLRALSAQASGCPQGSLIRTRTSMLG
jgi:hypothetical protein